MSKLLGHCVRRERPLAAGHAQPLHWLWCLAFESGNRSIRLSDLVRSSSTFPSVTLHWRIFFQDVDRRKVWACQRRALRGVPQGPGRQLLAEEGCHLLDPRHGGNYSLLGSTPLLDEVSFSLLGPFNKMVLLAFHVAVFKLGCQLLSSIPTRRFYLAVTSCLGANLF